MKCLEGGWSGCACAYAHRATASASPNSLHPCLPSPPQHQQQVLNGTLFAASTGRIDDRWRSFMEFQIARARQTFAEAEAGVNLLDGEARWPVW